MPIFNNKLIRRKTSKVLLELNKTYRLKGEKAIHLSDIDDILALTHSNYSEAKNACKKHLSEKLSVISLAISCLAVLSLSVYDDDHEEELFPYDWISSDGTPNANFILQSMLIQLSNYALATVELIEKGLDTPARAVLRTTAELSYQMLCLIADREAFRSYTQATEETQSKSTWYSLFAQDRIHKRLAKIERQMGLPESLVLEMRELRMENVEFFSHAVHHSYLSVMVGSRAWDFESNTCGSGLFGGVNSASTPTVEHLLYTLYYFIIAFFGVFDKIYRIKPKNHSRDVWHSAFFLHFCVLETYSYIKKEERSS